MAQLEGHVREKFARFKCGRLMEKIPKWMHNQ